MVYPPAGDEEHASRFNWSNLWEHWKASNEPTKDRWIPFGRPNPRTAPVNLAHLATEFGGNRVRTTHYRWWSFIPKNLMDQFRRSVNLYFLISVILAFLLSDPPVNPLTWVFAFVTVLLATMIKRGLEDFCRHREDLKVNRRRVQIIRTNNVLESVQSEDLRVGNVVYLEDNALIPCDLLLLQSSQSNGQAYVETSNLDGETNLKMKKSPVTMLTELSGFLQCDPPDGKLDQFQGQLFASGHQPIRVGIEHFLHAQTTLKRTRWAVGVAVYAGQDTKVALNSLRQRPQKFSRVEERLNHLFMFFFVLVGVEVVFGTTMHLALGIEYGGLDEHWYIQGTVETPRSLWTVLDVASVWFLTLNYLLPISLYFSVEFQKIYSAWLINWDLDLYDSVRDIPARCQNSDVTEELGLLTHLFTDKTGTLTQNVMMLKGYCSQTHRPRRVQELSQEAWQPFVRALTLCHDVHLNEGGQFVASSPDEEAIVRACQQQGFELVQDGLNGVVQILDRQDEGELRRDFQVMARIPFSSERKCMSVIVQDLLTREIILICKGAETTMFGNAIHRDFEAVIHQFASQGLRILVFGQRLVTPEEFEEYQELLNNDETEKTLVDSRIESGLTLIGVTAIEDQLQDGVRTTLGALKLAGIRIWMLTGDKRETSMTVAKASGLIQTRDQVLDYTKITHAKLLANMESYFTKGDRGCVMVLDGPSLDKLLQRAHLKSHLIDMLHMSCSVIACRLSPIQKSQIIELVKDANPDNVIGAVGDGGNDSAMIEAAHVGFGMIGHEGSAAARAADFAFTKFEHLQKIILVHGHWNYTRLATLILYSFYKNLLCFTVPWWLGVFSNFSGVTPYDWVFMVNFNLLYTSIPIVIFGITHQSYTREELLTRPTLHQRNRGNCVLDWVHLAHWVTVGFYQSLIILGVASAVNASDVWTLGYTVVTYVILTLSLQLLLHARGWNPLLLVAILGSGGLFFILTVLYSEGMTSIASTFVPEVLQAPKVWLGAPVMWMTGLGPESLYRLWGHVRNRSWSEKAQS